MRPTPGRPPTADRVYGIPGTFEIGLRVTDNGGTTATTNVPVTVNGGGVSNYGDAVLDTPGLVSLLAPRREHRPQLRRQPGHRHRHRFRRRRLRPARRRRRRPQHGRALRRRRLAPKPRSTSRATNKATVEFWLKWDGYVDDDALALELTNNFNQNSGGFIVDPNAPQEGGRFGVGIGEGSSRNNVFFARPSAGAWHHYAFVFDTSAPGAQQITPYVDGQAVSYTKTASGTGAGNFANSTLNLMSRGGAELFGARHPRRGGDLQPQPQRGGDRGHIRPPTAPTTNRPRR